MRLRSPAAGLRFDASARLRRVIAVAAVYGGLASPAHASLGRAYDSVVADRAHMAARMETTSTPSHTIHALTSPNGGVVREFMDGQGVVFAVSWRGPGRPDLQQLLGDRFETLQSSAVRSGRRTKTPLSVSHADFIVHSGGHPGAFWGVAYLPGQLPSGMTAKDLQ